MNRTLLIFVAIIFMFLLVDGLNQLAARNKGSYLDGVLYIHKNHYYFIDDVHVTLEDIEGGGDEILGQFPYTLSHVPFSFNSFKSGEKLRVWHDGQVKESYPAPLNVLKISRL